MSPTSPRRQRVYRIGLRRALACPPLQAFEIVCDLERFPEFMPNVVSISVLESEPGRKVAAWNTLVDDAPLEWVEEGLYDHDALTVRFRALEGVFDRFDGSWRVEPRAGGSEVVFELSYEIGLPEIEEIVGPILKDRLVDNIEGMLAAIERRAGAAP